MVCENVFGIRPVEGESGVPIRRGSAHTRSSFLYGSVFQQWSDFIQSLRVLPKSVIGFLARPAFS